ncbi:MAG: hypothetical protein V4682_00705 [Patescibacteria group bacterium]
MRDVAFFEGLFPKAGSWADLKEVNKRNIGPVAESVDRAGNGTLVPSKSCFSVPQVEHLNTIFELLDSNEEAKAVLAGIIEFTQIKDDCSGF